MPPPSRPALFAPSLLLPLLPRGACGGAPACAPRALRTWASAGYVAYDRRERRMDRGWTFRGDIADATKRTSDGFEGCRSEHLPILDAMCARPREPQ
eukprot:gene34125-34686_t